MFNTKTAVIGVGSMGRHHARVLNEISDLVAVIDLDKKQGMEIAKNLGVPWFSNFSEVRENIEAISIAVPTSFHLGVFQLVSPHVRSVLIEKPLSSSISDSKKIIDISKKNSNKLMIGQIERFNPVIQFAKEKLSSGTWGKIKNISARRFSNFPTRITDVGVILDLSIHDIDLINYLSGEKCLNVYTAGSKSNDTGKEEDVKILMNYSNGITALCETSWLSNQRIREIVILTDKLFVKLDLLNLKIFTSNDADELSADNKEIQIEYLEPLKSELNNFLLYSNNEIANPVKGTEGLSSVCIVENALNSLEEKIKIDINLI